MDELLQLDRLLFHVPRPFFLESLLEYVSLLLDFHGLHWALRYLQVYVRYLKWYLRRAGRSDFFTFHDWKDDQELAAFLDVSAHIIEAQLQWRHRDRNAARASLEKTMARVRKYGWTADAPAPLGTFLVRAQELEWKLGNRG
ncbi:MAG: hypothetical protein ACTSU5_00420 [Promethearchaeota archaeon]